MMNPMDELEADIRADVLKAAQGAETCQPSPDIGDLDQRTKTMRLPPPQSPEIESKRDAWAKYFAERAIANGKGA